MRLQIRLASMFLLMTAVAIIALAYLKSSPPSLSSWHREEAPNGKPQTDECYALEHFYGKTREQAAKLLQESDVYYIEDFSYMPEQPFRYYFPVLIDYILERPFENKSDAASMFFSIVNSSVESDIGKIEPHWRRTVEVMQHLSVNQSAYNATEGIYGSFREKMEQAIAKYAVREADSLRNPSQVP